MLGSHLSVAGGYVNALLEAQRLGFETVQIFTKNQRQWKAPPMDPGAVRDWLDEKRRLGWTSLCSHASYLINLASPEEDLWARSVDAMTDELERAEALEIPWVVVHPGSHKGAGVDAGLTRIAEAIDELHRRLPGGRSMVCLENTVGGGHQLGAEFEHLSAVRDAVREPERVGTCLDTCHLTAAGFDVSTFEAARAVFGRFDEVVGLDTLKVLHFNDSKFPQGSHRDRHEHIGDGQVGSGVFEYLLNDPRYAEVPMILETDKDSTPKGTPWDVVNLRRLRKLIRKAPNVPTDNPSGRARRAAASGPMTR